MYCKFYNEVDHMENLWHLMNPNFKSSISLDTIMSTVEDLVYIAIDQRIKMLDEGKDESA